MGRAEQILARLHEMGSASATQLATHLGISRQAIHRHIGKLLTQGLIARTGQARAARYHLVSPAGLPTVLRRAFEPPFPAEDAVYLQLVEPAIEQLPEPAIEIVHYTVTELFNNALEHAAARHIGLALYCGDGGFAFEVEDDGIGCFEKVRAGHGLREPRDAIEQLSKGKVTTAPEAHTGEGIFFSSKVATRFVLESDGLRWLVDSERKDAAIAASGRDRGTRVEVLVGRLPRRTLGEVFRDYATEDLAFDRTSVRVRLFERGEVFMSRSEAKRIVAGLDRFREVIVDFQGVRLVGQGFADEIFRVFAGAHPAIRLVVVGADENIAFMIRRSSRTAVIVTD